MSAMTKDDMLASMTAMWLDGVSATNIGKHFGVTRNKVMGYVARREWARTEGVVKAAQKARYAPRADATARHPVIPPARQPTPRTLAKPALKIVGNGAVFHEDPEQREPKVIAREVGAVPGSLGLRIIDMGFTGCRWPISTHGNDGAETRFCCAKRVDGKPYCLPHGEIATTGQTYGNGRKVPDAKELIRSLRRFA